MGPGLRAQRASEAVLALMAQEEPDDERIKDIVADPLSAYWVLYGLTGMAQGLITLLVASRPDLTRESVLDALAVAGGLAARDTGDAFSD